MRTGHQRTFKEVFFRIVMEEFDCTEKVSSGAMLVPGKCMTLSPYFYFSSVLQNSPYDLMPIKINFYQTSERYRDRLEYI
jgi:hypothetical protein